MGRRTFIAAVAATAAAEGLGQVKPMYITVIRAPPIYTGALEIECIPGTMFLGESVFLVPANGVAANAFCRTVELPYRNNLSHISSIPAGTYGAHVRTGLSSDGRDLGWRVELEDTVPRLGIQIHIGNAPANSSGCILVGKAGAKPCLLANSGGTVSGLRMVYGSNMARAIYVKIV